jgi:uncharacterized surface protein with fasciclin (FAS1) repeats
MKKTEINEHARSCCRNWPAIALVFALALGALLWATMERRKDILKTAASFPECSTFVDLVDKAGMTTVLAQDGPFTVFIPTNEAFAKIPQDRLAKISGDRAALSAVLLYHMTPETLSSKELARPSELKTCVVPATSIATSPEKYGDASFVRKDVPCVNGVVYVVDAVQIPPFMEQNGLVAPPQRAPEELSLVASEELVVGAAPLSNPNREAKVDAALENAAETVKTRTVDAAQTGVQAVADAANVVAGGAARVVEKSAQGVASAANALQEGAGNVADDAAQKSAEKAVEKAEEKLDEAKENAQTSVEKAEEKLDKAKENAQTSVEKAEEKLDEAKEKAQAAVEKAEEKAEAAPEAEKTDAETPSDSNAEPETTAARR